MALNVTRGVFNTGTTGVGTTVVVSGVGFAFKFLLLMWNGRTEIVSSSSLSTHRRGIGMVVAANNETSATSTSETGVTPSDTYQVGDATKCIRIISITGTDAGAFDLTTVGSDGFTLTVASTFVADYTISFMAFGGSDIQQVALVTTLEPATASVVNVDSIGFTPDVAFFMTCASGSANGTIADDSRQHFGVMAGVNTIINATWCGGSDDANNPTDTGSYNRIGECISVVSSDLTAINTRARVTARRTLGLELTYDEVLGTAVRETRIVAIKGGQWSIGSFLTSTDLANKVVSGFGFNETPKGGVVVSTIHTQSTVDILQSGDEWSMGMFTSPSSRLVMAMEDIDNVAVSTVQTAIGIASVFIGCNGSGGIDYVVDILSLGIDTITFEQDIMPASNIFAWVLTFADELPPSAQSRQSGEMAGLPFGTTGYGLTSMRGI